MPDTTPISRLRYASIGRVGADESDIDTGVLSDEVLFKTNNHTGGELEYGINDGWGPSGDDPYWNGTFRITEWAFDLLDWSQQPETLGPVTMYFDRVITFTNADGTESHGIRRYVCFAQSFGTGTWDRTTDTPRTLRFRPFILIDGGGEARTSLAKTAAAVYANTRTGELGTRADGVGERVNHYSAVVAAHGGG